MVKLLTGVYPSVLDLIKNNELEKTVAIENKMSKGVASYLYSKYKKYFDTYYFNSESIEKIDAYYSNFIGFTEEKYLCNENDGLFLLIKLTFDEFI